MLEKIPTKNIKAVAFRYVSLGDKRDAVEKLYKSDTPGEDVLASFGVSARSMVARVFASRGISNPSNRKTRYSDGTWPVYYCSAEKDTAAEEISFHYLSRAGEMPLSLFYALIQAEIQGGAKDLRDRVDEWPFMVDEDLASYEKCWPLGRQAHEDGQICALIVPSARKDGGTNMPTFREQCIVGPKIVGSLELSYSGDKIAVKRLD